ncbi:hypothetical protein ACFH04_10575 [Streptomyces noboritoensis]|uniref:Uncharacterized protein n=1 Tax=Streptomyces noboritoensis TaxID=67337 RepID=A0ABV6TED4_9ACTN
MRTRLALPIALVAAISVAATACQSSSGKDAAKTDGKDVQKAASSAADYNPQPYENIKDGGTYTTVGTFDEQGNPFNVNSTLTASRSGPGTTPTPSRMRPPAKSSTTPTTTAT